MNRELKNAEFMKAMTDFICYCPGFKNFKFEHFKGPIAELLLANE